jgi:competence protein ComEC
VPALSSGLAFLGNLALAATHLCARVPHACVPVDVDLVSALAVAAALACALYRLWPRPSLATGLAGIAPCACAFLAAFVFAPFLHGSEIDMLDVGQGDAFVLRSGTRAVLIDTGTNDTDLLKGLARHDVRSLDAVVITHADDDHCGSLPALLKSVPVGVVIVAADLPTCPSESCAKLMGQLQDAPVEGVRAGDAFNWGAFTARVVSPDTYADEGGNADSLVLVVTADPDADGRDDVRALFCGDAEAEVLEPLAEAGAIPAVDILKVPHHGSKAGVTPELLGALAPRIGLISVGEGNRYGHPRPETIQALEDQGTVVARTDQEGDVVCELRANRIVLAPSRLH